MPRKRTVSIELQKELFEAFAINMQYFGFELNLIFDRYIYANGTKFQGEWNDGKQNGTGTEEYGDGSKFEGFYRNGLKNGHGLFVWVDGSYYSGDFEANKIDGFGIYQWSDGRRYQGE